MRRCVGWDKRAGTMRSNGRERRPTMSDRNGGPALARARLSHPTVFRAVPRRRRGVALIVVLIGLAVATMIFLSILKLIAIERQSVELQLRQIETGWLAESGVERASARLAADATYHGETWNLSAQDIGGRDGARIAIRVDEVAGKPDRRMVRVEADYPDDPERRSRQVREVIVHVPH